MALENMEHDNGELELNEVYEQTKEELNNLEDEVTLQIEKNDVYKNTRKELGDLEKEINEGNPETIKIKNYEIKNYGTHFSIDISDTYGITMKKEGGEIVFDAKHEGYISEDYEELTEDEKIDNGNIDMINRYLKSQNQELIKDDEDIKILKNLFENLKE